VKKIVSGLIAVFMVAAALVAFSGSANAASPYGNTIPTYTHINAPGKVKVHHKARICVRVTSDGNGTPHGHITVRAVKRNGADRYISTKYYRGGTKCFVTTPLKRGKYSVKASFDRKAHSRFQDSDQRTSLRVTR